MERGRDIAGMWQSLRERRNEGIKERQEEMQGMGKGIEKQSCEDSGRWG